MKLTIWTGTVEDVLPRLEPGTFDACLCDPPYGLKFMDAAWDHGVPGAPVWAAVLERSRPGAYLLAFGGTRTYHRLACAIEDAGFEIRDALAWLYGSGFPKSLDISRQVDALDAVGPRRDRALRFTAWMRTTGVTAAQVNAATDSFMASHFFTDKEQPEIPTPEMFDKIRPLLSAPVPEEIEELIRSRQVESENVKRRPVVSERMGADLLNARPVSIAAQGLPATGRRLIQTTAAFTPLAQRWSGYHTALKPGYEPCVVAMKPLDGTFAANAMKHGVAGLNIDASRIPCAGGSPAAERRATTDAPRNRPDGPIQNRVSAERYREERDGETIGRWPANVVLSHSAACELGLCSPDCPAFVLDAQSGLLESGTMKAGTARSARSVCYGAMPETATLTDTPGDAGGASRFFKVADLSESERFRYCPKADTDERHGSRHPTLKPMDLCAYLARMLLPPPRVAGEPPRRILVPFAGAGSEVVGCLRAGWDEVVAIEMSPEFAADIRRRVEREFALLVTIEDRK